MTDEQFGRVRQAGRGGCVYRRKIARRIGSTRVGIASRFDLLVRSASIGTSPAFLASRCHVRPGTGIVPFTQG